MIRIAVLFLLVSTACLYAAQTNRVSKITHERGQLRVARTTKVGRASQTTNLVFRLAFKNDRLAPKKK